MLDIQIYIITSRMFLFLKQSKTKQNKNKLWLKGGEGNDFLCNQGNSKERFTIAKVHDNEWEKNEISDRVQTKAWTDTWAGKNKHKSDKQNKAQACFSSYVPDSHIYYILKTFLPAAPDYRAEPAPSRRAHQKFRRTTRPLIGKQNNFPPSGGEIYFGVCFRRGSLGSLLQPGPWNAHVCLGRRVHKTVRGKANGGYIDPSGCSVLLPQQTNCFSRWIPFHCLKSSYHSTKNILTPNMQREVL